MGYWRSSGMGIKDNRKIVAAKSGVTMRLVSFTEIY